MLDSHITKLGGVKHLPQFDGETVRGIMVAGKPVSAETSLEDQEAKTGWHLLLDVAAEGSQHWRAFHPPRGLDGSRYGAGYHLRQFGSCKSDQRTPYWRPFHYLINIARPTRADHLCSGLEFGQELATFPDGFNVYS